MLVGVARMLHLKRSWIANASFQCKILEASD